MRFSYLESVLPAPLDGRSSGMHTEFEFNGGYMFAKPAKKLLLALILIALTVAVGGCTKKPEEPATGKVKVMTTLFPLYDFAKNVGGDLVHVSLLVPPGVEVHSFDPKPGDILKITGADLFIYTGDIMEPWVQKLLSGFGSERPVTVNAGKGIVLAGIEQHHKHDKEAEHPENHDKGDESEHHHGGLDPHIWLDFANAQRMVDTIAEGLASKDPAHAETYQRNASAYKAKLDALDTAFRKALATCEKRVIIHGGHFAFNYLMTRYGLVYESAYSSSPNAEPTARRLIELRKKLEEQGLDTIFYEEIIEPRMAEVIAKDTGSKLLKLHGAHNVTKDEMERGVTFIQIMEQNLVNLKAGLKCR
jgi:zinc transport system substrate-binding protein